MDASLTASLNNAASLGMSLVASVDASAGRISRFMSSYLGNTGTTLIPQAPPMWYCPMSNLGMPSDGVYGLVEINTEMFLSVCSNSDFPMRSSTKIEGGAV